MVNFTSSYASVNLIVKGFKVNHLPLVRQYQVVLLVLLHLVVPKCNEQSLSFCDKGRKGEERRGKERKKKTRKQMAIKVIKIEQTVHHGKTRKPIEYSQVLVFLRVVLCIPGFHEIPTQTGGRYLSWFHNKLEEH